MADIHAYVTPDMPSVQAVLDALPADDTPVTVHFAPGIYREKLAVCRNFTELVGEQADSTVITWDDGAFELLPEGRKRGTFRTATLLMLGRNCSLHGLTVENNAYPREQVGQAIALFADGDGFDCTDCVLRSRQDTLFTAPLPPREVQKDGFLGPTQFLPRTPQRHVYRRCRIIGDIDFIFGGAAAWFEDCDIISIDGRENQDEPTPGYCTAASTPEGQAYGYVFMHCRFLSQGVKDGTVYLGRPWRSFAKTVLIGCELGAHIHPAHWHDWNKPEFHESGFYAEFGCYGDGSRGEPASFAHQLTAEEAGKYTLDRFMNVVI